MNESVFVRVENLLKQHGVSFEVLGINPCLPARRRQELALALTTPV